MTMHRPIRSLRSLQRSKGGLFIVVEGLDGCGKSTLARRLVEQYQAVPLSTSASRFGDARGALEKMTAGDDVSRQLLFATSVAATSTEVARLRAEGRNVVVDRYWLSTLVYGQVVRGLNMGLQEVEAQLEQPNLTLFLDAPAAVRRSRLERRSHEHGEVNVEDLSTLRPERDEALRRGFLEGLKRPIAGQGIVLDASGSEPSAVLERAVWAVEAAAAAA